VREAAGAGRYYTCGSVSALVEGSASVVRAVSPTKLSQLHAPQNELHTHPPR